MRPTFHVDTNRFNTLMNQRAAFYRKERDKEVATQARLLCKELIGLTPPRSGKQIKKQLTSQGKRMRHPENELLSAKRVGQLAVERDRRKIARKMGLTAPSGRILTDRESQRKLNAEVLRRQKNVGKAKAGWTPSFIKAGGKAPSAGGWIGRHGNKEGTAVRITNRGKIMFELTNHSSWVSEGEGERIILAAYSRRGQAMARQLRRAIKETWRKGGMSIGEAKAWNRSLGHFQ